MSNPVIKGMARYRIKMVRVRPETGHPFLLEVYVSAASRTIARNLALRRAGPSFRLSDDETRKTP